jgi:2-amino-4-hydroxy-6-hydroxymethyldihydropteridine diphosphokinase
MSLVYIGLGSNIGDREEQVLRAVHELRAFSRVKKISTLRETEPVGNTDQPKFINAVVEIETDYSPSELLQELLQVEEKMGRVRETKGGPRTIDLDILAYGNEIVNEQGLRIPHARMHERLFALEPMAELAPNWSHPALGKNISELISSVSRG